MPRPATAVCLPGGSVSDCATLSEGMAGEDGEIKIPVRRCKVAAPFLPLPLHNVAVLRDDMLSRAVLITCAVVLLTACDGPKRVCEPGRQTSCPCKGEGKGTQACAEDGSRWEACDCGGPSTAGSSASEGDEDKTYRGDMKKICDGLARARRAMERDGKDPTHVDPMQWASVAYKRLLKDVSTEQARKFLKDTFPKSVSPAIKGDNVRREATRVGIKQCAFAEWYIEHERLDMGHYAAICESDWETLIRGNLRVEHPSPSVEQMLRRWRQGSKEEAVRELETMLRPHPDEFWKIIGREPLTVKDCKLLSR